MHTRHNDRVKFAEKGSLRVDQDAGRDAARSLLQRWGGAPLMYFALLPDKRYLIGGAEGQEWGLAYRVVGRHALVLGDPFGDPERAQDAAAAFQALCRRRRWTPAFYQLMLRRPLAFHPLRLAG